VPRHPRHPKCSPGINSVFVIVCMALACGLFAGFSRAQEHIETCQACVCAKDLTCAYPHDCQSTEGCESKTFTVDCPGTYTVTARTFCTGGGKCEKCQACVYVYEGGSFLVNCHTTHCDQGQCQYSCGGDNGVDLQWGHTYTLYVCLIPCVGYTCADCGDNCRAEGCVFIPGSPCAAP
jgi:hypothetical protein